MIFLIEYDRNIGRLVTILSFPLSQREEAQNSRMKMEIDLNRLGIDHEVVLLEAPSRGELEQTHRRYFADLLDLLRSGAKSSENADHS